jgi:hypothetical protein
MYVVFQWVSGLVFGFELLTFEDIGMEGNGFICAINFGLFRVCIEVETK